MPGSLQRIAGQDDPEPFEAVQRYGHGLQIGVSDCGLAQHLGMPSVHDAEPVAQVTPLTGEPHMT